MIGAVAKFLVLLINLFTNISFYGKFSFANSSPANNHLGLFVIIVPIIGGLIVGIMARFGSAAIRGHGIPEAMEANFFSNLNWYWWAIWCRRTYYCNRWCIRFCCRTDYAHYCKRKKSYADGWSNSRDVGYFLEHPFQPYYYLNFHLDLLYL